MVADQINFERYRHAYLGLVEYCKSTFGENSIRTASLKCRYGCLLALQGSFDDAMKLYDEVSYIRWALVDQHDYLVNSRSTAIKVIFQLRESFERFIPFLLECLEDCLPRQTSTLPWKEVQLHSHIHSNVKSSLLHEDRWKSALHHLHGLHSLLTSPENIVGRQAKESQHLDVLLHIALIADSAANLAREQTKQYDTRTVIFSMVSATLKETKNDNTEHAQKKMKIYIYLTLCQYGATGWDDILVTRLLSYRRFIAASSWDLNTPLQYWKLLKKQLVFLYGPRFLREPRVKDIQALDNKLREEALGEELREETGFESSASGSEDEGGDQSKYGMTYSCSTVTGVSYSEFLNP